MTGSIKTAPAELQAFTRSKREALAACLYETLGSKEALYWNRLGRTDQIRFEVMPHRSERNRYGRKYGERILGAERSFHFQGPDG
ncbi:MAG TPA: hypothetical protein DD706_03735 [Nitrospiraceae bacterium]|nr:hypothetical protein [Nitrospiraceae bacterium]